jgi:hypothetical protein
VFIVYGLQRGARLTLRSLWCAMFRAISTSVIIFELACQPHLGLPLSGNAIW